MDKRLLAVVTALFAVFQTALAVVSADINDVVLLPGSIVPEWDVSNPDNFRIEPDAGTNGRLVITSTDGISFTYESDVPVAIAIEHDQTGYTDRSEVAYKLDDNGKGGTYTTGYVFAQPFLRGPFPAGKHSFRINPQYSSRPIVIDNLKIIKTDELGTEMMGEGNEVAITWTNDSANPWVTFNGELQPSESFAEEMTTLTGTFTTDKFSSIKFSLINKNYHYYGEEYIYVYIDDALIGSKNKSSEWTEFQRFLSPGNHTIKIIEQTTNTSYSHRSTLKDLEITSVDVTEINNPAEGQLGYELLSHFNLLTDVKMVKINGPLDDSDWEVLSACTKLQILDLSDAEITTIPVQLTNALQTVILPEGLKVIGKYAFAYSQLITLDIPASVEKIEDNAFYNSTLSVISFYEDSKLTHLGYNAFGGTRLKFFDMPDSVTTAEEGFLKHSSVIKVKFGKGLRNIPSECCYNCTSLQEIYLPEGIESVGTRAFEDCLNLAIVNFPSTITTIESEAFRVWYSEKGKVAGKIIFFEGIEEIGSKAFVNQNITEIELPSSLIGLRSDAFTNNPIATVKSAIPCPTPCYSFSNESAIELEVPDFALIPYKLTTGWASFGTIRGSKELATREKWSINGSVNLGSNFRLYGNPEVFLNSEGAITISGPQSQTYKNFHFYRKVDRENGHYDERDEYVYDYNIQSASYLSDCENSQIEGTLDFHVYLPSEEWQFFSVPADVKVTDIYHERGADWVIRYYDGARRAAENSNTGNWVNVPADGVLRRGTGYIVQASEAGYLVMPAVKESHQDFLCQPEAVLPLQANECESAANAGWNYLGNPYPTYFDINDIDLEAPITIFNGSSYQALSLTDDRYALRPLEGFFVQKPAAQEAATILRSGRQNNATVKTRAPRRAPRLGRSFIDLAIAPAEADSVRHDMTRVVVNEAASTAYEVACDAAKFMTIRPDVAQIFTIDADGEQLAINERPYDAGTVALGVVTPRKGEAYAISAMRLQRQAWIHDALTGIETELTEEAPFMFFADKDGLDADRFTLRFAPSVSGVEETTEEGALMSVAGLEGELLICGADGLEISVARVDGASVFAGKGAGAEMSLGVPAGVYVVKGAGRTFKVIVK